MLCEKGPRQEIQQLPKRHTKRPAVAVHIMRQETSQV